MQRVPREYCRTASGRSLRGVIQKGTSKRREPVSGLANCTKSKIEHFRTQSYCLMKYLSTPYPYELRITIDLETHRNVDQGQDKAHAQTQGKHAHAGAGHAHAGMAHACKEHIRANKGLRRHRLCRRRCNRQFASIRAVQVYGYGQFWCRSLVPWCICHGGMSNACHSAGCLTILVVCVAAPIMRPCRTHVVGAAWAATLLVCTRRCQSIPDVPRFRPGVHADCKVCAPHEPRRCRIFGGN